MKLRKKSVTAVLAVTMALFCIIGGTLAWLTASTEQVQNVFTVGDINLTLDEADTDGSTAGKDRDFANAYKMVPGNDIAKDPVVTVAQGSEKCWLFVKIDKTTNFDTYMTYDVADGWTALPTETGVYYRENVDAGTEAKAYHVLKDDKVTVKNSVTKTDMDALDDPSKYPTLNFTAYAVQSDNITDVTTAWNEAKSQVQ